MVLISGASSNHFAALVNLLASVRRFEPAARVVVHDLGLAVQERRALARHEVRPFPFGDYPEHVARLATFAWKPIIVCEVLEEVQEAVLWMDAGDLLHANLDPTREAIERDGVYTPLGWGRVGGLTHQQTRQKLGSDVDIDRRRCRHAALVGLHPRALAFAQRWRDTALDPEIICPPGARRGSHHFDQSTLSILAYQHARTQGFELEWKWFGVTGGNDPPSPVIASLHQG